MEKGADRGTDGKDRVAGAEVSEGQGPGREKELRGERTDTRGDQEATRVHRVGGNGSQGAWGLRQTGGQGAQRHLGSRRSTGRPAGLTGEAEGGGEQKQEARPMGIGIRVEALSHVGP